MFATTPSGEFRIFTLRPGSYPIPSDGPVGELLTGLDRSFWRPAHFHFIVHAQGYRPLTTQLFDADDEYLDNDTVFAVKDDLRISFTPSNEIDGAKYVVDYDFRLCPL